MVAEVPFIAFTSFSTASSSDWSRLVLPGVVIAVASFVLGLWTTGFQRRLDNRLELKKEQRQTARTILILMSEDVTISEALQRNGRRLVRDLFREASTLHNKKARRACFQLIHAASAKRPPEDIGVMAMQAERALERITQGRA